MPLDSHKKMFADVFEPSGLLADFLWKVGCVGVWIRQFPRQCQLSSDQNQVIGGLFGTTPHPGCNRHHQDDMNHV